MWVTFLFFALIHDLFARHPILTEMFGVLPEVVDNADCQSV